MKKNVIALLLAVVLASSSVSATPVLAAETAEQEAVAEEKEIVEEQEEDSEADETNESGQEIPEEKPLEENVKEPEYDLTETTEETEAVEDVEDDESADVADTSTEAAEVEEPAEVTEEEVTESDSKVAALANDVIDSGNCGSELTWTLDSSGTLTISGNGEMTDFRNPPNTGSAPWYEHRNMILSLSIEDGVQSIGSNAFYECNKIKKVVLPNSIESIRSGAFYFCSQLKELHTSDNLSLISDSAFSYSGLSEIYINDIKKWTECTKRISWNGGKEYNLYYNNEIINTLIIPDATQFIGDRAFMNCTSINRVIIPESISSIGIGPFFGCSNLDVVEVDSLESWLNWKKINDDTAMFSEGYDLYIDGSLVSSVVVPSSYMVLNAGAFVHCKSIKKIVLCEGTVNIEKEAFDYCTELEEITIPHSTIGLPSLYGTDSLKYVFYNGTATEWDEIKDSSFDNCVIHYSTTDHIWNEEYTVDEEATCTGEGSESIHCSICNAIDETTVRAIPKKEHAYGDWTIIKEPTCTETGSKEKVCAECGDKVTEEIPATGHVWNEEYTVDKEATCTEEGSESIHCSICDAIDETTVRAISKKEHAYGDWTIIKEPTCTEEGSKEKVCADCGDKVTEEIAATGHVWNGEYTIDKEATCTEEGSESIHCSICDAIDETTVRAIPKKEHAYGDWTVTVEPTCTEAGSKEKVCADCGDKVTEEIPATGHVWNEAYTVDKEATCIEDGSESIHCSVCGVIDESTARAIPMKGHAYGEWTVTVEPTCTEAGSKEKACANCGDKVMESIPAKGHVWDEEYTIDMDATCEMEGSESIHCSVCGVSDVSTARAIPALGHAYGEWTVTTEATCTQNGIAETQCANCGNAMMIEIPATGHIWNEEYTVDKEATCTEEGTESIHCSVCDTIDDTTIRAIEKKDHSYGDWTVTKVATCTEAGSKEKVCANCGDKITEEIPAVGHKWNENYTVDVAPTYTEEGVESIHCSVCGEIQEGSERAVAKLRKPVSMLTISGIVDKYYNGEAQTQDVVVMDGNTTLVNGTDYTVSYENNTDEGTASVIITGIGNYTGTAIVEFKISRITLEGKYLEISGIVGKTYNGKPQVQNVVVTYYGTTLEERTDYGVVYFDNTNVGKATVVIVGLGKYKGTIVRYFWINKAPNTITAKNFTRTYSTKAQTFNLGVKVKGGTPIYKSSSKSVTVSKEGKVTVKAKFMGKVTIKITAPASANYTETTKKITITVTPTKTALSSVTSPSAGKMTVKWKKNAVGTGYQIQYSTSSKFTSSKLVTITKNTTLTKTIGSLAKGKKYYVRIRTYKTVGSKKFYSGWSAAKAVTIKK